MKQGSLYEALFQIGALIFVVIVVHAAYVTVIRPNADLIQEHNNSYNSKTRTSSRKGLCLLS